MNVIMTCGGTGGHIYPAIAIAKMLKSRVKNCNILFIGSDGMEQTIVQREGFPIEKVEISGFDRKMSLSGIQHNWETATHLVSALRRAGEILKSFHADAVIGTGGYASFPALYQGTRLGIPTFVHESNAVPGLTTRLVADRVNTVFVPFEACRTGYRYPERVQVVGTPVREGFVYSDRKTARAALGLGEKPRIVSCWGSLGAREMNKKMAQFMALEAADDAFTHIHATGSFGWKWMPEYVRGLGLELEKHPNLELCEFIYDMPQMMAAADLMICRAGAASIAELTVAGVPAILVPSPNVAENHQEKNAAILAECGAAVVLHEKDCTAELLYRTARELLENPSRLAAMRTSLNSLAVVDSAERICSAVLSAVGER